MRGNSGTTAGQEITITGENTDTTINLPAGAIIDSVDVLVANVLQSDWSASLIGGIQATVLQNQSRTAPLPIAATLSASPDHIGTSATNVRITAPPLEFTANPTTNSIHSPLHRLAAGQALRFIGADLPDPLAVATDYFVRINNIAVTGDSATDAFTSPSHGLSNADNIVLLGNDLPLNVVSGRVYSVVNVTTHTFQIELEVGSGVIDLADNGSGSMTWHNADEFFLAATAGGSELDITDAGTGSMTYVCGVVRI